MASPRVTVSSRGSETLIRLFTAWPTMVATGVDTPAFSSSEVMA